VGDVGGEVFYYAGLFQVGFYLDVVPDEIQRSKYGVLPPFLHKRKEIGLIIQLLIPLKKPNNHRVLGIHP
jgi:hypothetical protein